ncbi:MAG: hypothetical protein U5L06_00990 [Rhodovibrio sp.]|nr:hypothetical protein [Rhodovibrio sp.]
MKEFFEICGNKKSVKKFLEEFSTPGNQKERCIELGNIIVNNAKDNEFFRDFTHQPSALKDHVNDPFFESAGHASLITFMQSISLATDIMDPDKNLLVLNDTLEKNLEDLKSRRVHGYFYRSNIQLAPIGALEIFEGQARLNQLQYLSRGLGIDNDLELYQEEGFFEHPYGTALEWFLNLTGAEIPKEVNSPVINAFLLVCDLSINPSGGFTNVPYDFENFLFEVDPGTRFVRLCEQVRRNTDILSSVTGCTFTEYTEISDFLEKEAGFPKYSSFLAQVSDFISTDEKPKNLIGERERFGFGYENMPMRLLLASFLRFVADKNICPEFFCWPGRHLSGENAKQKNADMFSRHLALFQDKP